MAAAALAAKLGLDTLLIDEQEGPGGQIYRAIEHAVRVDMPDRRRRAVAGAARPQRRDEGLTR